MQKKTAVVLVNIGTPKSPKTSHVRRYLFRFLNDRRVIDLPWVFQKLLVNLIIVPFRAPKSAKLYKRLWQPEGSPLFFHGQALAQKLGHALGDGYKVFLAMRYSKPFLHEVLAQVRAEGFGKLLVVPLFPQYASSTAGSVLQETFRLIRKWYVFPEIRTISQFYGHPAFIRAYAQKIRAYKPENYDHIVFSYHGLPNRQVDKVHPGMGSHSCNCHKTYRPGHPFCYKNAVYQTTRLLQEAVGIPGERLTVSFQSRLSGKWLQPFTDKVLVQLAQQGHKRVLVVSPAFVADCLETIVEIAYENAALFRAHGGEELQLTESLNADDAWARALSEIVQTA